MKEAGYQKQIVKKIKSIPYLKPACVQNEVGSNNVRLGAFWHAMGKLKGFSDLIIFNTKAKELYFVEMKSFKIGKKGNFIGKTKQSPEQIEFQKMVEAMGFKYFLIDDPTAEDKFFNYVLTR